MGRLIKFDETVVMTSVRDNYFNYYEMFTSEAGFELAFGISGFDENQEPIDDPRYGRLNAMFVSWGTSAGTIHESLAMHNCTREELGLEDGQE